MYKFEFEIKGLPPTTNSGGRTHWAIKVKIAKLWKEAVAWAVSKNKPPKPLYKAKITITRYSSSEPDFDGMVSGGKHLLDGLKFASVIIDDKMSIIGAPTYIWVKAKRNEGRVTIKIEELSNDKDLRDNTV